MIKVLTGLPDGVIGFETEGEVHAEDYRDVLIPEVEKAPAPLRAVRRGARRWVRRARRGFQPHLCHAPQASRGT